MRLWQRLWLLFRLLLVRLVVLRWWWLVLMLLLGRLLAGWLMRVLLRLARQRCAERARAEHVLPQRLVLALAHLVRRLKRLDHFLKLLTVLHGRPVAIYSCT